MSDTAVEAVSKQTNEHHQYFGKSYETQDQDFDYPIADKTLNSLLLFQVNFNDLKKVLDFIMANQKKQQHLIDQMIDSRVQSGELKVIEKIVHLPNRDDSSKSNVNGELNSNSNENYSNLQDLVKGLQTKLSQLDNKQSQTDLLVLDALKDIDKLKLNESSSDSSKKVESPNKSSDDSRVQQLQADIEKLKQNFADLELMLQRSDRASRRNNLQIQPQGSIDQLKLQGQSSQGHSGRHTASDDLVDKLRMLEFKVNDHEQKFKLLLQSGRRSIGNMGPRSFGASGSRVLSKVGSDDKHQPASALIKENSGGLENNSVKNNEEEGKNSQDIPENENHGGGFEMADILALIDQMKEDFRLEFASKITQDQLMQRMDHAEQDLDQLHLSQEIDSKKLKEILEKLEAHQTRLNTDKDNIEELQEEVKKLNESLKNKADIEDAESISNLVNDLYERFHELQKGTGDGQTKPPIQRVTIGGGASALGSRGNPALGNIQMQLDLIQEKFNRLYEDVQGMSDHKEKIKEIFISLDKKANVHELIKSNQQIDDLKTKKLQLSKDLDAVKKYLNDKIQQTTDQVTQIKNNLLTFQTKFNEAQVKNLEIQKFISERGNLFGIGMEDDKKVDEEVVNEINEKITILQNEIKKILKSMEHEAQVIDTKLQEKIDYSNLPKIEEKILMECDKLQQKVLKRVAEKQELQAVVKHFDKLIKNLHTYIKNKFSMVEENDDAILSKKPLGGFSCVSCDKQIKNLSLLANGDYNTWNKLPNREPIARLGQGFSKILSMIKPGAMSGGGNSLIGTARQMMNESQSYLIMPNTAIGKSSMPDEDANIQNNVDMSRFSQLNSTAPNFNSMFDMNLHVTGSQTARNTTFHAQGEISQKQAKDDTALQSMLGGDQSSQLDTKASIYNTTVSKPKLSKGPILVKGGKITGLRSQSQLPSFQVENEEPKRIQISNYNTQQYSSIKDYKIIEKIGQGSFGTIYKVRRESDGKLFVMKQASKSQSQENGCQDIVNEIKILQKITNSNIVKYVDSFNENSNLSLIIEYCEKGDLADYLSRLGPHFAFNESKIWRIIIQLCLALEDIHNQRIIHADVKPQNILLTGKDYDIKLADFGVSQTLTQNYSYSHNYIGTLYYCSPEVCQEKPFDSKVDIWALGIIIYELCTRRKAFEGLSDENLKQKIIKFKHPQLPKDKFSEQLSKLYNMCLSKDSIDRPKASEILSMSFVIDWAKKLGLYIGHRIPIDQVDYQEVPEVKLIFKHKRNSTLMKLSKLVVSGSGSSSTQQSTQGGDSPQLPNKIINQEIQQTRPIIKERSRANRLQSAQKSLKITNPNEYIEFSKPSSNMEFYKDILKKTQRSIIGGQTKIDYLQLNQPNQKMIQSLFQISPKVKPSDQKRFSTNQYQNSRQTSSVLFSYQTNPNGIQANDSASYQLKNSASRKNSVSRQRQII
eukprot:403364665